MKPVVLITGGTRRVGLAIARAFARAGCDLVLTFNTSADDACSAERELTTAGAGVKLERLDFDDLSAVDSLGTRLGRELPRLDVLVHNASVYGPTPTRDLTAEALLRFYRVNAAAPLLLSKHLAPRLAASPLPGGGAIVAMADMHALGRPRRDFAAYSMSKAALVEMVRTLSRDLAPRVRVNAVAPGVVAFPERGYESDPAAQAAYVARVPLGRSGTPEDAAEVVRWLALDAHYVTGEVLRVDGGRWLA
ncbi:MAG: SDR family oxidoreductase [Phycisphaerales bacterium]